MRKYIIPVVFILFFGNPCFSQTDNVDQLIKSANEYLQAKNYDNAIDYSSKALLLSSQNFQAYNIRGLSYLNKGNFDAAIGDLSKAIEIHPDFSKLYYYRGVAYFKKVQYTLAIGDLNKTTQADPADADAFYLLGISYSSNQNYQNAEDALKKAIGISSGKYEYYSALAHNYYMQDDFDNALSNYKKVIDADASRSAAYYGAGLASLRKGVYEDAVNYFKKTIEMDAANGSALISLVGVLVSERKFGEASGYYAGYVKDKPKSTFDKDESRFYLTYIRAAVEYAGKGDFVGALKEIGVAEQQYNDFNIKAVKASSLKNRYADMLAFKGYLFEKLNEVYEAKNTYRQSINLNANQPEVKDALQKLNNPTLVSDKTAPVITLITPEAKDDDSRSLSVVVDNKEANAGSMSVNQDQLVKVVGRAKDASGLLSVKINGQVPKSLEEDGLFIGFVDLKKSNNQIIIEAVDKNNNVSKKTFTVAGVVNSVANAAASVDEPLGSQSYYAIIIGEQDYKDVSISKLSNPVKDAREFAAILGNLYTFQSIDTLFDRSREDILEAINNRCNTMKESDNLLIFYAGHGTVDPPGSTDGYLVPVTAVLRKTYTYIPVRDISDALKNSKARHVLFIADACYSGSLLRDIATEAPASMQVLYKKKSRTAMTSGNLEPVPDKSQFIYYVKTRLRENTEKFLPAKKLFADLETAVINNSNTHPQYGPVLNVGDEGGDFVFIKK